MGIIKRRRYYFTDSSYALDTIIADVMAAIALVIEVSSVIASVVTGGHIAEIFNTLYVCACILSISGFVFAMLGRNAQEGGVKGKRISIILNVFAFLVILGFLIAGLII